MPSSSGAAQKQAMGKGQVIQAGPFSEAIAAKLLAHVGIDKSQKQPRFDIPTQPS